LGEVSVSIEHGSDPTPAQFLAIIRTQTEIAKLGLDLNGVMDFVTQEAQAITNATGAVIEMADADDMVYRAVAGMAEGQLGLRLARLDSLSGQCVATARALRCDDAETDPRVNRAACLKVGLRSMIVVPLIHLGQAVGALKVMSAAPRAFTDGDLQVLGMMSELIAAAMFHAAKYGSDALFQRATRDGLTGLANRALFYDRLRLAVAQAQRKSQPMAVLMLDMDGLKPINDRHGHRAGDAAIKEIAARLSTLIRQVDTAARLGGDEFGVLLAGVADRDAAHQVGKRITEALARPFSADDTPLQLGASIGIAVYPEDGTEPDGLVHVADQAMYVTKRARKRAGLLPNRDQPLELAAS
jgi:diguanylate cyclase (GGDEF)-like protein